MNAINYAKLCCGTCIFVTSGNLFMSTKIAHSMLSDHTVSGGYIYLKYMENCGMSVIKGYVCGILSPITVPYLVCRVFSKEKYEHVKYVGQINVNGIKPILIPGYYTLHNRIYP